MSTADDDDMVEITLHASAFAELLIRLDRFVDRQDDQADRNWLRQFVRAMRVRAMQDLN